LIKILKFMMLGCAAGFTHLFWQSRTAPFTGLFRRTLKESIILSSIIRYNPTMNQTKTLGLLKITLPLLAALVLISGCAAKKDVYYNTTAALGGSGAQQMAAGRNYAYSEADMPQEAEASLEEGLDVNVERKLAKRANLRIRVENLEAADASIAQLMEKYGAYAASTEIAEDYRHYSIRVPSTEYDAFLAGMDGMGRMLNRSESAEDVTLRYYDLEGRLATKRELLKTYQSYLGKAKNIEEILSVEARIAELQNEIEGTGKELRNLAGRVDFSVIELAVLGPVSSTPYRGPTLGERIRELFRDFGEFLSVLAVVLVGIVVYGIPILLLLVLFYWLLFGKIGLLKKLMLAAAGKNQKPPKGDGDAAQ